ncbi:hypothetical protein BDV12DRAFT_193341 [Aspergillus spectabilis]
MPTPSSPITLYDIGLCPPVEKTCCSPNPWKARQALNFKALPYATKWVGLPDIEKVRSGLKVAPVRKFLDGSDFFTLPIIEDPGTESLVGDSFDIAVHLQKTYPDAGAGDLFPEQKIEYVFEHPFIMVPLSECNDKAYPEYAKFNMSVDAAFSAHVQLTTQGFPFDPATAETVKAEFVRRAASAGAVGVTRWEDFALVGEAREKMKESFRETLGGLGELFKRDSTGPFMLGTRACYADFIVGAWLKMMRATLPEIEWVEVRGWHGGVFGRLHDALEVFAEVK